MATMLTKKYQKKLAKVLKFVDIVTAGIAVLETRVSKALNDGGVDERELPCFRQERMHTSSLGSA